jgi:hypothetical protein
MLINSDGKPIGSTPDEAAAIAVQTIASRGREVLVALETIGIRVPLPIEVRAGTQVARLDREGLKLERIEKPKKAKAAVPENGAGAKKDDVAAQVKKDAGAVAAAAVAGLAAPPSFP